MDLVFYGDQNQLEYDFIVAPGIDPSSIALDFNGAKSLRIDRSGSLVLALAEGEIQMQKPFIYQEIDGKRQSVPGRYVLLKKNRVGFAIGAYDSSKPLMIDPVLIYSTFIGGFGDEEGMGLAVDGAGNMYLCGNTTSLNLPMLGNPIPFQSNYGGGAYDGFIVKLNAAGDAFLYTTYLGGNDWDTAGSVAVDSSRNAYITGTTKSTNFPTQSPRQANNAGGFDSYVTKLSPDGSSLVYSTYMGGNGDDSAVTLALDSTNNAIVSGKTQSTNLPTVNPIQANPGGGADAYLFKLNSSGSALVYSSYIGGSNNDSGDAISVDGAGNAWMAGTTLSPDLPTKNPLQASHASPGLHDVFITKVDPNGLQLFTTYLGGSDEDAGDDIAVDSQGNAYVSGRTMSPDFLTKYAIQFDQVGMDAFVTKINAAGTDWVYSTYLGGSDYDAGWEILAGPDGSAYITGNTKSLDFPILNALQATYKGGIEFGDAYVTKINPSGSSFEFSTYLGGTDSDRGRRLALDSSGVIYLVGQTYSADFPLQEPLQNSLRGTSDAFIVKMCAPRFTVTSTADSGPGSLRQAVKYVCPGGTVDFSLSYPATIILTSYLPLEKDLTISGPGAVNLTISGGGTTSLFYNDYSNPRKISISDLTIAGAHSVSAGGGIYNFGELTVTNVVFRDNQNGTGSGIYNGNTGVLTVIDSTFNNNQAILSAFGYGGGIANEGTAVVIDSAFSGNSASWGGAAISNYGVLTIGNSLFTNNNTPGGGAGIHNVGNLTITMSTFSGNSAYAGGGIANNAGILSVNNTTFSNNTAGSGAGVSGGGTITIRNSTFSNNSADGDFTNGGGIDFSSGTLGISNSTFYANSASRGGGISGHGGTLTVSNSTFSQNSASQFGGAINIDSGNTLNLLNTILANSTSDDCTNNGGSIGIYTNNLIENNGTYHCGESALTGDPDLGALADNGGTTMTMALQPGSPAIDAGSDTICAAPPVNNLDQRGMSRPQGSHCDIGAYESEGQGSATAAPTSTLTATASPTATNTPTATATRVTRSETITLISSDSPDPSLVGRNIRIIVSVTGGPSMPAGTVMISAANAQCSITLNKYGTGACSISFSSTGSKTITAVYLGDPLHKSSIDSESHYIVRLRRKGPIS